MSDNERKLTPANENPWYWLATMYGEQAKKGEWDHDLAAQNRAAWNRWMASVLSHEQRGELKKKGLPESELTWISPTEQAEFTRKFADRAGQVDAKPPPPTQDIDFRSCRFDCRVSFSGFLFPRSGFFEKAAFSGGVTFFKAAFFGSATFMEAAFSGDAEFSEAAFFGAAAFYKAAFYGGANFFKAAFSFGASFGGAKFSGVATFMEAAFSGDADFGETAFFGAAGFKKAMFSGNATFGKVMFSGDANFDEAAFSDFAYFREATFCGHADFLAAEFKSLTVFAVADFQTSVPDFRDAKLREATEWHGATWPPPPKDKGHAQRQVYAYERLKAEMERVKKHADEQFFFAQELRARRALEPRWSLQRSLNWAYEISSGYGQSVARPIFWLVVLFAPGAVFFALAPVHGDAPLAYDVAAGLSVTNLFSLLPYKPKVEELSAWAKIIGDIQSVLGLVLLFLLGLALRNRFRMR
ncbi:MAG: pentapeptide repeat-containing protein [Methylocystis sp.]|nr:pentapeptide repeat-containing protein [Methylocystis sp.]